VSVDLSQDGKSILVNQFERVRVCSITQRRHEIDILWNGETNSEPFGSFKSAVQALARRCRASYARNISPYVRSRPNSPRPAGM
jgi:hypothetical protein